jgi:hypothetical protein
MQGLIKPCGRKPVTLCNDSLILLSPVRAVTFITSHPGSNCMHDVVSSKKMENGIVVFWEEKGEKTYESFNYSELIDMKINALDLLERPKSYKVDKDAHTLIVKK